MANTTPKTNADSNDPIYIDKPEGAAVVEDMFAKAFKENNREDIAAIADRLESMVEKQRSSMQARVPQIYAKYQTLLARAKWYTLYRLQPEEIAELFRLHFAHFFDYTLEEVLSGLRSSLLVIPEREKRDEYKRAWREALASSQLHIGEAKIKVTGVLVDPTLSNWLRDWRDFLGDRKVDSLMTVEYLNSSENIRALPTETRTKMSQILKLYVELLKSSTSVEGLEEKLMVADPYSGTYHVLDNGQLRSTPVEIEQEELKQLRDEYMLDENGRPLPLSERVKRLPEFEQMVKATKQNASGMPKAKAPTMPEQATVPTEKIPVVPPQAPATGNVQRSVPGLPPLILPKTPPVPPAPKPVTMPKVVSMPAPQPAPAPKPPVPPAPLPKAEKRSNNDPREMAEQVLGEYKLLFPSVDIEKRFLSLLVSYFNEVRDRAETHEALIRVPEEGGVGMQAAKADDVLRTADDVASGVLSLHHLTPRKKTAAAVFKPKLEDVMKMAQERKQHEPDQPAAVEDILSSISPIFDQQSSAAPMAPLSTSNPLAALNRATKPVMHDITATPKAGPAPVMGPLDELRSMNMEEFRRISPDPKVAAQHIYDKVQLLEIESIEKKAEGIRAWQQSPVNQLYIAIGNESLEKSSSVGAMIDQRKKANQPTMTEEEFTAIADVNRRLRF